VQLQTGLKGKDLFLQSKALNLINNQEWWYRKTFTVPAADQGKLVRLRFDAVDYFSTVWLNGEKLGDHDGAAEGFSFDISKQVKFGAENTVVVKVTCPWLPKDRSLMEYAKNPFNLPIPETLPKPPYALGGGWGGIPVYGNMSLTMGVIRDVKLEVSEPVVVEDLFVYTKSLNADGSATIEIAGNAKNYRDGTGEAKIDFDLTPENFKAETIHVPAKALSIQPGDNQFTVEMVVRNPQLWWTWDLGPQNLYRVDARLTSGAGGGGNSASTVFGIRTIERDENLSYRLNGKRLFLRGVWYAMSEYYPSRSNRQSYERDLRLLRASYANHLVTQVPQKQAFYSLCDELGVLVLFEFPFPQFGPYSVLAAGNPRREPFLKNAKEQVQAIVKELRAHPSIVQWSPLAEAHEADGKWAGPQEGYDFFIAEMKKTIQALSPDTIFHASLCDLGEHHIWNENYRDVFDFQPLMVSEYGEISPPVMETFKEALTADEIWSEKNPRRIYNMPVDLQAYMYWTAWEYNDIGMGVLNMFKEAHTYIDQNIGSAQELVDDLQLTHAYKDSYATEAFRRKMHAPINGIRTWAFRDVYPGIQYGMVDSNGIPKMNYYFYKRAQQPLAVSFAYKSSLESQVSGKRLQIPVWVANEYRRALALKVDAEILTTEGDVVWSKSFDAEALPDASQQVGVVDWVTPDVPGVYILRGRATEKNGTLATVNTAFIKVTPKAFANSPRVLVIGWKRFTTPIASILEALGARVDVIDEASLERLAELKNANALRANYDVVWLAPLDHFWKLVEPAMGDGLAEAVRQGVGFVHSGGNSAFHGGDARPADLDLTRLGELLPVKLRTANEDVVYPAYTAGQALPLSAARIHEIAAADPAWTDAGLNEFGVEGYNQVDALPEGKVELTIEGHPLLATGRYGQGRTVAFTGFTPSWDAPGTDYLDEQFDNLPQTRAYFGLFSEMLAAATGSRPAMNWKQVLAAREKPLFQMLKEQPAATVETAAPVEAKADGDSTTLALTVKNGKNYARLVRLRIEWDGPQPYISLYGDNYFDLLPGESKSISLELKFPEKLDAPAHGRLIVAGSNLAATEIPVPVNP
jgi:beta-mannosidase